MIQNKKEKSPDLVKFVEKVIQDYGLLEPGAKVLIGVSGGPDSLALLSLLSELRPKWGWELSVLHCHHGLRRAADEEESFVRDWSHTFGCPFASRRLPVREYQKETGKSLEEAARDLRYRAFEDFLNQDISERVALAHTANDQAEEVLIGLIRGTGLGGLTGMALKRGPFVRPLLRTLRREILEYLAFKNIPYQEDASNKDFRYLRAQVRHHLLEELKGYSPNIINQLNQTAGLLQKDEDYLQEQAANLAETVVSHSGQTTHLDRKKLQTLPQALASRIIQRVLLEKMGHLRHIRSVHILSFLKAANGLRRQGQIPLPNGFSVRWDQEALTILPVVSGLQSVVPFCYTVKGPGTFQIPETGEWVTFKKVKNVKGNVQGPRQRNPARVDLDTLAWPLVIRTVRPGDRFQPLGLEGSKKVSRFLMDRKVPKDLRSRIPLICSGEEIVWIAGQEIGHPFRLTPLSSRVLEMTYGTEKGG